MFVLKGNQSVNTPITEADGDEKEVPPNPPAANTTPDTFPGWARPGDEFIPDL